MITSAAVTRNERRICIGLRCYVVRRVKRFHVRVAQDYAKLVLGFSWGLRELQLQSSEVVGTCGRDTIEF